MSKKRNTSDKQLESKSPDLNNEDDSSSTRSNSRSSSKSRKNRSNVVVTKHNRPDLEKEDLLEVDSDTLLDSDVEEGDLNRSGNVPIDWYDKEDHIGYTVEGKRLVKELDSTKLGQLIFNSDNPDAWRTIVDPRNNRTIRLSDDDLKLIRRIREGMYPSESYDPEAVTIEYDNKDSIHPVSYELPPKSRFLPSKWEAIKVAKLVKLIKTGKIFTSEQRRLNEEKKLAELERVEDIWKDAIYDVDPTSAKRSSRREIKAPKTPLPTNAESYNPPEEYLLDEEETKRWKETEPQERDRDYLPTKYDSLRVVPVYANLIVERFRRCLQLLMCPRALKMKMNVDPDSILPKLPDPSELGPFPKVPSVEYRFKELKRVSMDSTGRYVAVASSKTVNVCDVLTGRSVAKLEFSGIQDVLWHPKLPVVLVSHENHLTLVPFEYPNLVRPGSERSDDSEFEKASKYLHMDCDKGSWKVHKEGRFQGLRIDHADYVKSIAIHPGGNYLVCVCPDAKESINQCVLHCLPKKSSMRLGNKISNNKIKLALFHPSEPKLIVGFTRNIRVYNLSTSVSAKENNKLVDESKFTGVELPVSMDTNGTYLLSGDEQGRVAMFDQEISTFPYKTFSFENEPVVKVQLHTRLPLAVIAYKKSLKLFHLSTSKNGEALFVPLNELKFEGLNDCSWHDNEPWLFTATKSKATLWV